MSFFQGSSNFSIHESQFSVVQGSQYNITHIHNNRVIVRKKGRKKHTIWDEYERVRTGNVNLMKLVGTGKIYDPSDYFRTGRAVAHRTFSISRIRGEDKESGFLYIGYSGPEALEIFKRDFKWFSAIKHPDVAQLFGYNNYHGLPALIFYDALIPLNRVILPKKETQWSLDLYFRFQASVLATAEDEEFPSPSNELWIDPRSGAMRRGPSIEGSYIAFQSCHIPFNASLNPLSIQTYSDTNAVVDYLARILPDTIFGQLSDRYRSSLEQLIAGEAWPYLANSLWKRKQQDIIAQWTVTEIPRYVNWSSRFPLRMEVQRVLMEDGSVRFPVAANGKDFERGKVSLSYKLLYNNQQINVRNSWLTQAHSVFSQLGIHEGEWEEYCIVDHFWLEFHHTKENACEQVITDTRSGSPLVYLFIRPIPRPFDDERVWRLWAENDKAKYFWSFDPSGQEEMTESTRVSLGLPSFTTKIEAYCYSWAREDYQSIEKLHLAKGYDPKTTDYARSLGYPLMQAVGDEDRFEELEDSTSSTTIADILESYNRDDDCSIEGYSSDEERILYPRLRETVKYDR